MSFAKRLRGVRLKNVGLIFDEATGYMISHDGSIVKEGLINAPTGYRIADDGQIMEIGILDTPTGFRIDETGELIRIGNIFDTKTGKRVGADGGLYETQALLDKRVNWPSQSSIPGNLHDKPERENNGETAKAEAATFDDLAGSAAPVGGGDRRDALVFASDVLVSRIHEDGGFDATGFVRIIEKIPLSYRHRILFGTRMLFDNGVGVHPHKALPEKAKILIQKAIVDYYESVKVHLGIWYGYTYTEHSFLLFRLAFAVIFLIAFILYLFGPSGWLASLVKAALQAAFWSFIVSRVLTILDTKGISRQAEVKLLHSIIGGEISRAEALVPVDSSWMWTLVPGRKPTHYSHDDRQFDVPWPSM